MAKFRQVHSTFWQDAKVLEEMTPEDKYFYLYLLTNPNTTQIGVYQITKKQMAFDLGYSPESVNSLLDRFINHHKVIKYNADTRELAILHWGKYNLNKAGKPVLDCIKKELEDIKDKTLLWEIMNHIPNEVVVKEFSRVVYDTYHESSYESSTSRGQEEEQEQEEEKEEEKEEEQQKEKNLTMSADDFYQQNFGILNSYIGEQIQAWVDDLNEELVIEAMKRALAQQKKWKYAEGILKNWANTNVRSLMDVQALDKEFERRKGTRASPKPIRTEVLPGWFDEEQQHRFATPEKEPEADIAAKKQEIEELLSGFRNK
jgi:DnaD/phage-associated family protein